MEEEEEEGEDVEFPFFHILINNTIQFMFHHLLLALTAAVSSAQSGSEGTFRCDACDWS